MTPDRIEALAAGVRWREIGPPAGTPTKVDVVVPIPEEWHAHA